MKHRILITGGLGLVGGRVAQLLAGQDNIVLKLGSRRKQTDHCWLPKMQVVGMDWQSQKSLMSACEGIDTLVHLAGMNAADCMQNPVAAFEINALNTARLMEAVKLTGVKRVIYFSTAHVYAPNLVGTVDEFSLAKNLHPYATSHRAAEDLVMAAASDNIVSIVLRLSNGFGKPAYPNVNSWELLVNELCRQAVTLGSMTLRSTGLQRRDFITLHDVARVVKHMIVLPVDKVGDGLFNVGSGKSSRVIDMVELIQERCSCVMGYVPKIIRQQPNKDERSVDFEYRINKLLNTSFSLEGKAEFEIDAALTMCSQHFKTEN
jgi:UDP-glucose 4-epimerase